MKFVIKGKEKEEEKPVEWDLKLGGAGQIIVTQDGKDCLAIYFDGDVYKFDQTPLTIPLQFKASTY